MMGTFFVGCIVAGCAVLALRSIIGSKKKGKLSCGGDCGRCGGCH